MTVASYLLATSLRVTVLLLIAWLATGALRRKSAASRHAVWTMGLISVAASAVLPAVVPQWELLLPLIAESDGPALGAVVEAYSPAWVGVLWLVPALVLLTGFLLSVLTLNRIRRGCERLPERHRVCLLASTIFHRRPVSILVSDYASVPFVCGVFRPAVVMPTRSLSWSATDLRSVLVHEIGHIQRKDVWIRYLGELVSALVWFHPLVWLCVSRLRHEGELACDELVVADGRRCSEYAQLLVRLSVTGWSPRSAVAFASRRKLYRRLQRILAVEERPPLSIGFMRLFAVVSAIAAVSVAACALPGGRPVMELVNHGLEAETMQRSGGTRGQEIVPTTRHATALEEAVTDQGSTPSRRSWAFQRVSTRVEHRERSVEFRRTSSSDASRGGQP